METIMSITSSARVAPGIGERSWSRRLGAALEAWWTDRMARRLEALAMRQLRTMSDRELRDPGVLRSYLEWAARSGRSRVLMHRF
jgi:hypothetical protein